MGTAALRRYALIRESTVWPGGNAALVVGHLEISAKHPFSRSDKRPSIENATS
jgi:hypothetical protein